MSSPTVRDMVKLLQAEMRTGDLTPSRACEILTELTSLMGNCLEEQREADHAYNVVLLACLDGDEAANRATIRAKVSPEYLRAREAKDFCRFVEESVRSLKIVIKSADNERQVTR